jgi:hypothetical protein
MRPTAGWVGVAPHKKKKYYISPVSQEQRNKKAFLTKLQKHCGEFCRQRRPWDVYVYLFVCSEESSSKIIPEHAVRNLGTIANEYLKRQFVPDDLVH